MVQTVVMSMFVSLSVTLSSGISKKTTQLNFTKFYTCCLRPWIVLLWRRCNTVLPVLWMTSCFTQ